MYIFVNLFNGDSLKLENGVKGFLGTAFNKNLYDGPLVDYNGNLIISFVLLKGNKKIRVSKDEISNSVGIKMVITEKTIFTPNDSLDRKNFNVMS